MPFWGAAGYSATAGSLTDADTLDQLDSDEFLQVDNNLDDVGTAAAARTNLGLAGVADGAAGADLIGMTTITETGANATVQSVIEALITELKDTTDSSAGADLIGATAISGWTGGDIQTILEAAKVYVDGLIAAANAVVYAGTLAGDASVYPAADAGDLYVISSAGTLAVTGPVVAAGDMVLCDTDSSAEGNHATVGANWNAIERNLDVATASTPGIVQVGKDIVCTAPLTVNAGTNLDDCLPGADADVTFAVGAASTSASGVVELAIASEVNTGTSTTLAVTPDALAGSNLGIRYFEVTCYDYTTTTAVADGVGYFFIPPGLDGMDLVYANAMSVTAGTTSGATTVQVRNLTDSQDMLSGNISIAYGDLVGTAGTVDTADSHDAVATNDRLRIDCDAVCEVEAEGLIVCLGFQLP